jgi:hypothetical protein
MGAHVRPRHLLQRLVPVLFSRFVGQEGNFLAAGRPGPVGWELRKSSERWAWQLRRSLVGVHWFSPTVRVITLQVARVFWPLGLSLFCTRSHLCKLSFAKKLSYMARTLFISPTISILTADQGLRELMASIFATGGFDWFANGFMVAASKPYLAPD